ncbi:import inner membrane translocase subunit tim50 [Paecilomyces variotii No. 5]|uniref:Mitochondrial import inner membrane translocase subunit TIM50 n=1 Tax=Byssochlamys spectabilis (strain No. 5 / NBRC 109023) TaxID=1356009 RepID=V5FNB9_BYSSN|nr:import inner membrane translocase subunit tim50 [Paecilomyces variotii No. 5]
MLSRAVLLTRPRVLPAASRLAVPAQQPRWYAKNSKPKGSYKLPDSVKKANTTQSGKYTPTPASPSLRADEHDISPNQADFALNAGSQKNTPPQSAGAGAGVSEASTGQQGGQPDFTPEQSEFETTARPKDEPQRPLPDLTQGIPSTLAAELDAANRGKDQGPRALNLTEEPYEGEEGEDGGRGGDGKGHYESSLDRRRAQMAKLVYGLMGVGAIVGTAYLGRNWETEELEKAHPNAPSGWGLGLWYDRVKARMNDITSYYKDPPFHKLLPDEDPNLRQPYTLVLSLEDLLVHSEWTREHGWRVAKRPGVDYFLRYLNQYYELVLFTTVPSMMADQVLRKLDPYRIIRWPLFREATKYKDGEYIKDLSYLNRDLSKVILIDTDESHARLQPENAVILPKWKGDSRDKTLVALIPLLEYIAGMGIEDVRPVLKSFEGTDIPIEFAKREKAMREKFQKQLEQEQSKRPRRSVGNFASLLGLKPSSPLDGEQSTSDSLAQGKMLWDQIRERGQKNYEMIEKEIRENGEKWLAEMAAEEEKARQEQMKSMKSGLTGMFGAGESK